MKPTSLCAQVVFATPAQERWRLGSRVWNWMSALQSLVNEDRFTVDDFRLCIDGKSSGAVRISVGMVTNFNDVQSFLAFAKGLLS